MGGNGGFKSEINVSELNYSETKSSCFTKYFSCENNGKEERKTAVVAVVTRLSFFLLQMAQQKSVGALQREARRDRALVRLGKSAVKVQASTAAHLVC